MSNDSLKIEVTGKATEVGVAIETCLQKVQEIRGFASPMDALQYMTEHLIACVAMMGVPASVILTSCMGAIAAGNDPEAVKQMEKLAASFEQSH